MFSIWRQFTQIFRWNVITFPWIIILPHRHFSFCRCLALSPALEHSFHFWCMHSIMLRSDVSPNGLVSVYKECPWVKNTYFVWCATTNIQQTKASWRPSKPIKTSLNNDVNKWISISSRWILVFITCHDIRFAPFALIHTVPISHYFTSITTRSISFLPLSFGSLSNPDTPSAFKRRLLFPCEWRQFIRITAFRS